MDYPVIKKKLHKPKINTLSADFPFVIFSISDTMTIFFKSISKIIIIIIHAKPKNEVFSFQVNLEVNK